MLKKWEETILLGDEKNLNVEKDLKGSLILFFSNI